jgi:hypothetical protein
VEKFLATENFSPCCELTKETAQGRERERDFNVGDIIVKFSHARARERRKKVLNNE